MTLGCKGRFPSAAAAICLAQGYFADDIYGIKLE